MPASLKNITNGALFAATTIHSRRLFGPLAFLLGSTLAVVMLSTPSPSHGPVAVVFPPWWGAARSIAAAAAGGSIVAPGAASFVVIVEPEGADFASQLRAAGAFLIFDLRLVSGCVDRDRAKGQV